MIGVTVPTGVDAHTLESNVNIQFNSNYGLLNVYTRYVETCKSELYPHNDRAAREKQ